MELIAGHPLQREMEIHKGVQLAWIVQFCHCKIHFYELRNLKVDRIHVGIQEKPDPT